MFLIISAGFILGKVNMITESGNRTLSNIMVYVVSPCMMITAFQRELVPEDLQNFGMCFLLAAVVQVLSIFLATLAIRSKDKDREAVLRFSTVFSNCGFMAYPLQTAMLGTIGVFFGSAYVSVFYILIWTYGIYLLSKDKKMLKIKNILLNPGVLSVVIALALYLLRISLPSILVTPMSYLAGLNTPVPMLIVGYQLSKADLKAALKGTTSWIAALMRLIVIPLIATGLCLLLRLDPIVTTVIVVAASTPPAAMLSIFCALLKKDSSLASSVVSLQTLFSIATMPLMVGLAQYLSQTLL